MSKNLALNGEINPRLCSVSKDHSAGVVIRKQGPGVKNKQNNQGGRNKERDQVNTTKHKLSSFYF